MRGWLRGRVDVSSTVSTFSIEPEQPVDFLAGQYIELTLPHQPMDSRGDRRWFTISNAPGDTCIELTMRLPEQPSTFKRHLSSLGSGVEVRLGEVLGDFVVPMDKQVPLVLIADGIGLTPYLSMIRDLTAHGSRRNITLHHAVRTPEDRLFYDVFENYGLKMQSQAFPFTGMQVYQASTERAPLYYLAGSENICLRLQTELLALDVPRTRIALDYFSGYPAA